MSAEDKCNDTLWQKLQGRWEVVAGVNQGREMSKSHVECTHVTFTTNTIVTFDRDQQAFNQAVFTLDEEKKPVRISMRVVANNAPNKPRNSNTKDSFENATAFGIVKTESESSW